MTGVGARFDSLRLSSPEMRRLGLALALSFAVHLFAWGGYAAGKEFGWWQRLHWPTWLPRLAIMKILPSPVPQNNEEQLTFVEVAQPTTEAPPNAKYYSSQNSRAADPTKGNKEIPQLNGKQTEYAKTENVPRPDFNKLQPASPAPQQKLQPAIQPGDLTLGKPENSQQQEQQRPRTVSKALAQQQAQRLPGQQMKQEGGTRRPALVSSLDVKATPFGDYDSKFIEAVTQRWYDLLDSRQFAMDRSGKVTLRFHLNYDGSIVDMKVLENTVGDVLSYVCQKAVTDPAPFAPWPADMRRIVGENYREITFTFYYY
ncbi:MAG: cell envelope integrity protein TolA [Verrucomicrobiota bacterium]|jgi:hypothetical protein